MSSLCSTLFSSGEFIVLSYQQTQCSEGCSKNSLVTDQLIDSSFSSCGSVKNPSRCWWETIQPAVRQGQVLGYGILVWSLHCSCLYFGCICCGHPLLLLYKSKKSYLPVLAIQKYIFHTLTSFCLVISNWLLRPRGRRSEKFIFSSFGRLWR